MIRIGAITANHWSGLLAQYAQNALEAKEIPNEIRYFEHDAALINALRDETIDVLASPLKDLPTVLPMGIVITAVSQREHAYWSLVTRLESIDDTAITHLKKTGKVIVPSEMQQTQLLHLRPDVATTIIFEQPVTTVERLKNSEFDACVLTGATAAALQLDKSDFAIFNFSPKEFVPQIGQGVIAYLANEENISARRMLKAIHFPEVATVTNVERRLLALANEAHAPTLCAYCERDANQNYHLWAMNAEGKQIRLSHNTHFELAERAFEMLST
jgi:porphobilinogen deaminase